MRYILAVAAMAISAPAMADPPVAPASEQAKVPKPKKFCRTPETASSSRMGPDKVCHTAAEWAEIDARGGWQSSNGRSVISGTPRD